MCHLACILLQAAQLGFGEERVAALRALFALYDVNKNGTLEENELECVVAELGHEADCDRARALQAEFGDVPRDGGAERDEERAVSFGAFLRLVAKLEELEAGGGDAAAAAVASGGDGAAAPAAARPSVFGGFSLPSPSLPPALSSIFVSSEPRRPPAAAP